MGHDGREAWAVIEIFGWETKLLKPGYYDSLEEAREAFEEAKHGALAAFACELNRDGGRTVSLVTRKAGG